MSILAERLKKLRKASKQSQGELGRALGKSRETISKYELGEREPGPESILTLAKHFNVSTDYILGSTNDPEGTASCMEEAFNPELHAFEGYLKNKSFIPYLHLTVKMKDSNIELQQFETLINNYIKQENTKCPL